MFVGTCSAYYATQTTSNVWDPKVLRGLAQTCNVGEVNHAQITFENQLGLAKISNGGFASTMVGCTLNGTLPLVYKEFGVRLWPRSKQRFSECSRELFMTTVAWQSAPQFVSPILHFGIHEAFTDSVRSHTPFLVSMDHGTSLDSFLSRPVNFTLTMSDKRNLCLRLLGGLAALHAAGVFHGDIRAANVVLSPSRPDSLVYIDFGLSRRESADGRPEDGFRRHRWTSGTIGPIAAAPGSVYAPEYGRGGPTSATDMWALAPILVRILIRDAADALRGINDDNTNRNVRDILKKRCPYEFVGRAIWQRIMDCTLNDPTKRPSARSLLRLFKASTIDPRKQQLIMGKGTSS